MKLQTLIEGNFLIASFVAMRIDSIHGNTWIVGYEGNEIWHNEDQENWKFHSSFDWLMPVILKLGAVNLPNVEPNLIQTLSLLERRFQKTKEYKAGMPFNSIEALWISVVGYLKMV